MGLLDGYLRLLKTPMSRLGWRIVLAADPVGGWRSVVKEALQAERELADLLPKSYVEKHKARVELLATLKSGNEIDDVDRRDLEDATCLPLDDLLIELGVVEAEDPDPVDESEPRIVLTTSVSSKGLQAQHVFVVGVNEDHVPKKGPLTDDEVCKFLVALTRTRKSCHVLSCGRFGQKPLKKSTFVKWLAPSLDYVYVNKEYITNMELPGCGIV